MKVIYFQVGRKETAQSWTLCQSSASQGEAGGKKSSVSFSVSFTQTASEEIHPAFTFTPNSTFTFTSNSTFTFIFLPFLQTNPHSLHPNHYLLLGLKEIVIQVGDTGWEWQLTIDKIGNLWHNWQLTLAGNWKPLTESLESMSSQQKLQRLMCSVKQGNLRGEKLIEALVLRLLCKV